ncbi:type II secretion system protein GspC [Pseudocolwellia sp. HL-MZ19]|uniref:type II secretion system protein GspC n=1 Tax=Pseudocolwellia sp. HL-MZ19 TaxID=3400846 RepID=UPI003CF2A8ED
MQLSHSLSPIAETLLKLPHAKIAKILGLFILIYIAYLLSKLTWLFLDDLPQHNPNTSNAVFSQSKNASASYNLSDVKSLNLFGEYNQSAAVDKEEDIEDAPETNLKLTLTGVAASDVEAESAAIIQKNGVQEIYAIDETINGTRAVLKKVYNDRVHIRHSGRLETLMLDGFDYNDSTRKNNSASRKPNAAREGPIKDNAENTRIDNRSNEALTTQAQNLRDDINEDPGKITDYLKISPKREDGQIIGYRLMPGKNPEFFKTSGLKSGDVAIQMNGFDLSQPSEAAQALKALKQEQELSLLVKRNDDITEILFSIN